jgi:16S rRNA (guanine527-N7)-methyltransferase
LETEQEFLKKGLLELGLNLPADADNMFLSYLSELKKWNRAYNLTALKNDRDIIIKHFFDSLLFLKAFPQESGNVCDVGSGAGFPGIPIGILRPDISITLIEPSRKKYAFLKNIIRVLGLNNITVIESRVEGVQDSEFTIAVTRALFSINEFVEKTKHLVIEGGCFILSKGPKFQDELKKIPAYAHFVHIEAILPLTSLQRHLIRVTI